MGMEKGETLKIVIVASACVLSAAVLIAAVVISGAMKRLGEDMQAAAKASRPAPGGTQVVKIGNLDDGLRIKPIVVGVLNATDAASHADDSKK
jgi:hypothetical protein